VTGEETDNPKIRRLFPEKDAASAETDLDQIRDLLNAALPESEQAPVSDMEMQKLPEPLPRHTDGPDPAHPNVKPCPQCYRPTWVASQHCHHCRFDLWQHAQQLELQRQQRWREQRVATLQRTAWMLALGGLGTMQVARWLPASIGNWFFLGGFFCLLLSAPYFKAGY
jgi:hypothetical protein